MTIQDVILEFNMYFFNTKNYIQQLKIFKANNLKDIGKLIYMYKPQIESTNLLQLDIKFKIQDKKIQQGIVWSNPAKLNKFDLFMKNAITVCMETKLNGI